MEPNQEVKERIDAFLADYGKLVEKHRVDFINYPQWMPDGTGGWKMLVQTQPTDTTNLPKPSPFVQ